MRLLPPPFQEIVTDLRLALQVTHIYHSKYICIEKERKRGRKRRRDEGERKERERRGSDAQDLVHDSRGPWSPLLFLASVYIFRPRFVIQALFLGFWN